MAKKRRKKLLPVDTPSAKVLKSLAKRLSKDAEVLAGYSDCKDWPVSDLKEGSKWLTWLANEKSNEEKRLVLYEYNESGNEIKAQETATI